MIGLDSLVFTSLLREGAVWTVSIARPEQANVLNHRANVELEAVFDAFVSDGEASVAILTGSGSVFCAGHDYAAARTRGRLEVSASGFGGLTRRRGNSKPIIAAVNGDALDEGFELALACDIIVANEDARFAMQQLLWARAPTEGGVHRLMRQIPPRKAMAALLTGAPITAAEGVLLGFVNDITSRDQVLSLAAEWALRLCKASRQSLFAIKEMAAMGEQAPSLAAAMEGSYPELQRLHATAEHAASIERLAMDRQGK